MKTNLKRLCAIALVAAMSVSAFASCSNGTGTSESTSTASESASTSSEETTGDGGVPLVVAYDTFNQKFNPFFSTVQYDSDVASIACEPLIGNDRSGAIIYNGIEGETHSYNGTDYTYKTLSDVTVDQGEDTTTYTIKLREGVKFADGEELTADDVIFSYYVYLDPTYDGSTTLYSEDIVGLQEYRTQTSSEVYEKYNTMFDYFQANGDAGEYGDEMLANYNQAVTDTWKADLQGIVDGVFADYGADPAAYGFGSYTADDLSSNEGLKIAYGMFMWSFATYDAETGILTATDSGATFDLANGTYPTIDDFYATASAKYPTAADYDTAGESYTGASVMADARENFISTYGSQDESMGDEGVPNISGIQKVDDYTVSITTNGFSVTTIYNLGIRVAPMHYYGDESLYDYENNQFGFEYGNLDSIRDNLSPMGTGPYVFDRYENRTVYFNANENYWQGAPKIKTMQWRETNESDKVASVGTGTSDLANPSGSLATLDEISSYNSNGEANGDVLQTLSYDFLGYGYIGLNALNMKVGTTEEDIGTEASRNLRKGFATLFAVYRNLANDSYYGDAANVIEYSISNCSWAAPQPTDDGYEIAYSTDVDGNPIYTADMTDEERFDAALQASIGFFKAAGYTWDEATQTFTAAPEGAEMSYEVICPANGGEDHPAYLLCEYVRQALEKIGITLVINNPSDQNVIWNALEANTEEMWCAAWSATLDPDMYQTWHSKNVVGAPGSTGSNHAYLIDEQLDQLIMDARTSSDQEYRKAIYKECLDIIKDWGVEVPYYQRQEMYVVSAERVNVDTITPDVTPYWNWMNDIQNMEMN